jgi:hypothetical protein
MRRAGCLCRLQGWLDHACNTTRYSVLKLENIFQCAVKAVGPEMRPAQRVD